MKKAMQIVCAAAALAVGASVTVSVAGSFPEAEMNTVMTPGKGLILEVGDKRAISYFQTNADACDLTVVVSAAEAGANDSPGTRIVATVAPGNKLRVDAPAKKSAEFFCGPAGQKMNARVIDRPSYTDLRS
jgi:hypothetical protein